MRAGCAELIIREGATGDTFLDCSMLPNGDDGVAVSGPLSKPATYCYRLR